MNNDTFADRLLELMYQKGISYRELADAAGISYSLVNAYVNKGSLPNIEIALWMAKALGTSIEYLFGAEGFMTEQDLIMQDLRRENKELKDKLGAYEYIIKGYEMAMKELASPNMKSNSDKG